MNSPQRKPVLKLYRNYMKIRLDIDFFVAEMGVLERILAELISSVQIF